MTPAPLELSIIIVSFNTCDLLRSCLAAVLAESAALRTEIFVVDNASTDGSASMVRSEFPQIRLIESSVNLGFGAANNLAFAAAQGRFFVLLNSDAFLATGALSLAIKHMEQTPGCALGGGLLVSRDGSSQPSARSFHTILRDAMVLTGLAARFPQTHVCGSFDRTWADGSVPCEVDWVPGAFCILRPEALRQVGIFDPAFFLYYEEVDLCLRLKRAGYSIWYWPDIVVTHIGGESSRQLKSLAFSPEAAQVVLWRMRSTLLYYRKHHGPKAWLAKWLEKAIYQATVFRNSFSSDPWRQARRTEYRHLLRLMDQAWQETAGGRVSPPSPW